MYRTRSKTFYHHLRTYVFITCTVQHIKRAKMEEIKQEEMSPKIKDDFLRQWTESDDVKDAKIVQC